MKEERGSRNKGIETKNHVSERKDTKE